MNIIQTTDTFDAWFDALKDRQAVLRIQTRIDRAENGNLGDVKPVAEGVSEMRIDFGPGYRVYFTQRGQEIVILLAGGNKSTQPNPKTSKPRCNWHANCRRSSWPSN